MPRLTTGYMTPEEVADLLRVKVATLYEWRSNGRGPKATKIEGFLRYHQADIADWLERSNPERDWLTLTEAAKILGVSPNTMYDWRRKRKGPQAVKLEGALRFDKDEILHYKARRTA
ncbi:helix-turn-helix domain-containing protein [Streptomyces sp. 5.8]|uniref:helix-turn-helix domain-containing protein n=1 Tax=Streptomyces sp. 5.8 TaxID=3406571 RepID=UPI003BB48AD6